MQPSSVPPGSGEEVVFCGSEPASGEAVVFCGSETDSGEAVVFCGIQGSGKSTFYVRRFVATHDHISLDELNTRNRERLRVEECIGERRAFVADNTNPTPEERRVYLRPALEAGWETAAYWFDVRPRDAIARNGTRAGKKRIPIPGILGTYKRLRPPGPEEGWGRIYRVLVLPEGEFELERYL